MAPGPSSGSLSDPFSPSAGSCVAEQGLLGSVLSLCEDVSVGAEPLSPWAGEGGYCRAPGFEREDQVRRMDHSHYERVLNLFNRVIAPFMFIFYCVCVRRLNKGVLLLSSATEN